MKSGCELTDENRLTFTEELFSDHASGRSHRHGLAIGKEEAQIHSNLLLNTPRPVGRIIHNSMSNWRFYHFHDTGETAPSKLGGSLHVHHYLRPDGSNLAAYLYWLKHFHVSTYEQILKTVQLAVPFLHDFQLDA